MWRTDPVAYFTMVWQLRIISPAFDERIGRMTMVANERNPADAGHASRSALWHARAGATQGGRSATSRIMQTLKSKSVLSILVLLISVHCEAQSNVYSLAIYSGGNSWADLCSLTFPF